MKLNWKSLIIPLFLVFLGMNWSVAQAMITLKQVQVKGDTTVDLIFDGHIDPSRIVTEYFNDIVQLSIRDVSIYPAKITLLKGKPVTKLFAYQYSPHLVRCRFSVVGKADDFKKQVEIVSRDRHLIVKFNSPQIHVQSESPVKPTEKNEKEEKNDDKEVLAQVLSQDLGDSKSAQKLEDNTTEKTEPPRLGSAKPLPSFGPVFLKLALVILLLVFSLVLIKKLKSLGSHTNSGMLSALKKFAKGSLKPSEKLIEIVSIHHIDPKKSIAVARVAGRLLVLGISSESINLITQISDKSQDLDAFKDSDLFSAGFEDILGSEASKPMPKVDSQLQSVHLGARSRIRSRLEGLKPL